MTARRRITCGMRWGCRDREQIVWAWRRKVARLQQQLQRGEELPPPRWVFPKGGKDGKGSMMPPAPNAAYQFDYVRRG